MKLSWCAPEYTLGRSVELRVALTSSSLPTIWLMTRVLSDFLKNELSYNVDFDAYGLTYWHKRPLTPRAVFPSLLSRSWQWGGQSRKHTAPQESPGLLYRGTLPSRAIHSLARYRPATSRRCCVAIAASVPILIFTNIICPPLSQSLPALVFLILFAWIKLTVGSLLSSSPTSVPVDWLLIFLFHHLLALGVYYCTCHRFIFFNSIVLRCCVRFHAVMRSRSSCLHLVVHSFFFSLFFVCLCTLCIHRRETPSPNPPFLVCVR